MERISLGLMIKIAIVLGVCVIGIFIGYFFIASYSEGDPYFVFIEVPANTIVNSTVIHLEDKDIMNIRGLDVTFENGKIVSIRFRHSAIHPLDFNDLYGSRAGDPNSRKFLEYKGVYYYGLLVIP
jgi:hypothetical protein